MLTDRAAFKEHATAPFCWLERPGGVIEALGGRDELSAWAVAEFPGVRCHLYTKPIP